MIEEVAEQAGRYFSNNGRALKLLTRLQSEWGGNYTKKKENTSSFLGEVLLCVVKTYKSVMKEKKLQVNFKYILSCFIVPIFTASLFFIGCKG